MSLFGAPQSDLGADTPSTSTPQPPQAKPQVAVNQPATVIAEGVRLEGEFKSRGDVQVEGEVLGTVETNAILTVGSKAKVKASVKAVDAVVAGEIMGNVTVSGKLELKQNANIIGDINCKTIMVEAGAKMQGNVKCNDGKSDTPDKPAQSSAKPEEKPIVDVKPGQNLPKSDDKAKSGS